MTHPDHQLGARAEETVAAWLTGRGWSVLARRRRTSAAELDLVARDPAGVLVAVEVKCRRGGRMGTAAESLGPRQIRRLRRGLVECLATLDLHDTVDLRIDLVTVEPGETAAQWRLRRIPQVDAW